MLTQPLVRHTEELSVYVFEPTPSVGAALKVTDPEHIFLALAAPLLALHEVCVKIARRPDVAKTMSSSSTGSANLTGK